MRFVVAVVFFCRVFLFLLEEIDTVFFHFFPFDARKAWKRNSAC